jgi:hypothetical protein
MLAIGGFILFSTKFPLWPGSSFDRLLLCEKTRYISMSCYQNAAEIHNIKTAIKIIK